MSTLRASRRGNRGGPLVVSLQQTTNTNTRPTNGIERSDASGSGFGRAEALRTDAVALPDVATCDACLRELRDGRDRRHRYAFIECARCGPRLSATARAKLMCDACRAEVADARSRRYGAARSACSACGPTLVMREGKRIVDTGEAIEAFAKRLVAGAIGALKGPSGYSLVCDATSAAAVRELRARKARNEAPFSVMFADVAAVNAACVVSNVERDMLLSPARPVVLLEPREPNGIPHAPIAPGVHTVRAMLPHTALQQLLLDTMGARPLVFAAGNVHDEPTAFLDDEALAHLAAVADVFLSYDAPLTARCEDSVVLVIDEHPALLRRARGYAPGPVRLPRALAVPTLALGSGRRAVFALGHGRRAYLSQPFGDVVAHDSARRELEDAIAWYELNLAVQPVRLVHDLCQDDASTRYALARQRRDGLERLPVQHHRAHVASVMATCGVVAPVIGVAFDEAGYGDDGAVWGGEFFVGSMGHLVRAAHLAPAPMPGGEVAVREPWRMAASYVISAGIDPHRLASLAVEPARALDLVSTLLEKDDARLVHTSSMARLFDAVAGILGVSRMVTYPGQAAAMLEALATEASDVGRDEAYDVALVAQEDRMVVDPRGIIRGVVGDFMRGESPARVARRFHHAIAEMTARVCGRLRWIYGINDVVLAGDAFENRLLVREVLARLQRLELRVHRASLAPPSDDGIALGQLALIAARDEENS